MNGKDNRPDSGQDYIPPDGAIESLARCLLPAIQAFFESENGQKEFSDWKKTQEVNDSEAKH